MGLFIVPNEAGALTPTWTADRKLWKTQDGRIVEDGNPDAAVLYATAGDTVPLTEAQLYGLAPTHAEVKQRVPARNKQRQVRDAQQKAREALRDQQARERDITDEPETENPHG
jgi:hypothetical protein